MLIEALYQGNDCLVFSSKLETWGMPISEAKEDKCAIITDVLAYAYVALGHDDGAPFFPAEDANHLAALILDFRKPQLQVVRAELPPIAIPLPEHWEGPLNLMLRSSVGTGIAVLTE